MIRNVSPSEANSLISQGAVDVVDVREQREWATGHIEGARLVPLGKLKQAPQAELPRDGIMFVCAKGLRSLTAAKVAETAGKTEVYSLDGGTLAWAHAGLPLVS